MKKLIAPILLTLATAASAATIAIIDSGVDGEHQQINPQLWTKNNLSQQGRFKNVIHGWDFVRNNNQILDRSLLALFSSPDLRRFYDIRAKNYLFQNTEEDRAWAIEKQKDEKFMARAQSFGTYAHGTHVSGIAIKDSANKVMGVTLLKTNIQGLAVEFAQSNKQTKNNNDKWEFIEIFLKTAAARQGSGMKEIGEFIHLHKAEIANGSYGTSFDSAKSYVGMVLPIIAGLIPTAAELDRATQIFMQALVLEGKNFVGAAPKTLFVFAAGNESSNNDELPFSPANIEADNVITVAATYKDEFFAPFSNFGVKTVEVAAPGMLIYSASPGEGQLLMSGTSQAAPFVSNVAGKIKDVNPALLPKEIKAILMGTVDKKSFLSNRVASGGLVNAKRAQLAASYSQKMTISEAIERSFTEIPMEIELKSFIRAKMPLDVSTLPDVFTF